MDGDGQQDAGELGRLIEPVLRRPGGHGDRRVVLGVADTTERILACRIAIGMFGALISLRVRQRTTDTTSGFRAVNRRGIRLFAVSRPAPKFKARLRTPIRVGAVNAAALALSQ